MRAATLFWILAVSMGALCTNPTRAATSLTDRSDKCTALRHVDFSKMPDAPTQLTETKQVEASQGLPALCEVSGYVAPQVGFLLRFPSDTWNGKFLELGCGGFCGAFEPTFCDVPVRRGYACILSDFGHRSTIIDAKWAYNNVQAKIDYGYRGAHVVALAGKAIVARYFDRWPKYSYFFGGSTGGRQALMEAQRFPWDFDGIIVGAPWPSDTFGAMNKLWMDRALFDSTGKALLDAADIDLLHRAVVSKCDLDDGVKDGVIGDPQHCAFEPNELRCADRKTASCLSEPQIAAVRKAYSSAMTSTGTTLYLPGAMKGSEKGWLDSFVNNSRFSYFYAGEEFRYCLFNPDPGPTWRPEDFDFDRDYKRLGVAQGLYDADNPDIRRFKAAGGKLLGFVGWSDPAASPLYFVDYYDAVEKLMGGRAATQDFFRLFVVPGMRHGLRGDGATVFDWLSYLESWVERDLAPDKVVGYRFSDELSATFTISTLLWADILETPFDPKVLQFTRPVYPYPKRAMYSGHGNPNDAATFGPIEP